MTLRRGVMGTGVVLSALVMSGCVVFQSTPTVSQNGVIGSVRITVTVCASRTSGTPPPGSCTNTGNSTSEAVTGPSQVFLAFRVPQGTIAPSTFTSTATGPMNTGPQLTFTLSSSYSSELQRLDPPPAGERWVGYVSQYVAYNSASSEQNFTASVDFGLPKRANGSPFAGPFTYQAVVGGRRNTETPGTPDPNEPVPCGNSLTTSRISFSNGGGGGEEDWICVDDQYPTTTDTDVSLATRDAGIVPGATVTAKPGSTASVPFTFVYAGTATPAASFTFSAATSVKSTSAKPSITTLTPTANSTTPVKVTVKVPKKTAAGTYTVTLTARLADGESRTGTVLLVVPGRCHVPSLKGHSVSSAFKRMTKANCRLGKVRYLSTKAPKGTIVSQNPKAGKVLKAGSKVKVTVSLGPQPRSQEPPD